MSEAWPWRGCHGGLDPTVGNEQRGVRPCVVISDLDLVGDQCFPLLCVVPVTGTAGQGLLYPKLLPVQVDDGLAVFPGLANHRRNEEPEAVQ